MPRGKRGSKPPKRKTTATSEATGYAGTVVKLLSQWGPMTTYDLLVFAWKWERLAIRTMKAMQEAVDVALARGTIEQVGVDESGRLNPANGQPVYGLTDTSAYTIDIRKPPRVSETDVLLARRCPECGQLSPRIVGPLGDGMVSICGWCGHELKDTDAEEPDQ